MLPLVTGEDHAELYDGFPTSIFKILAAKRLTAGGKGVNLRISVGSELSIQDGGGRTAKITGRYYALYLRNEQVIGSRSSFSFKCSIYLKWA